MAEASSIPYRWNPTTGRYYGADGRFVSLAEVRSALDHAIVSAATEAEGLVKFLNEGTLGLLEWQRLMQVIVKDTQIYAGAVAAGGYNNVGPEELTEIIASVGEQYQFLADWTSQLYDRLSNADEAAKQETEKAMMARARMYPSASRGLFDKVYRRGQKRRGYDEERSILHPAEHCNQCVAEAQLGWVPIGEVTPIGQRTCLSNCKCTIEYRTSNAQTFESVFA